MAESNAINESNTSESSEFFGLLARYENPDSLVNGCHQARLAGYTKMDAFSPFPVHGIDGAIGIQKTKLPIIVFCVALMACGLGVFLQFYTNGYTNHSPIFPGYPFKISGKPMYSLPANIPVIFEVIVLLSAFAAFFGMWILNGLPKLANPLFRNQEFRRSTSDGFFLFIEKADGSFSETGTRGELQQWGAVSVDRITAPEDELQVPGYAKLGILIVASLILVPPVVIYRAQYTKNPLPRMHVNPDMDRQFRGQTQDASPIVNGNPLFADDRVMRKDPPGTIARGELARLEDSMFYHGVKEGSALPSSMALISHSVETADDKEKAESQDVELDWAEEFPRQIKSVLSANASGMAIYNRGKQRFDVYCSACHGYAGYGDGHVSNRGMALNKQQKAEWVQAKSMFDPKVMSQPVGRIFDTITNGRGAMAPYRSQIPAADRWAIIVFVKSMQISKTATEKDVPQDARLQRWEQVDPLKNDQTTPPPEAADSEAADSEAADSEAADSEAGQAEKNKAEKGKTAESKAASPEKSTEESSNKEPSAESPSGEPGN